MKTKQLAFGGQNGGINSVDKYQPQKYQPGIRNNLEVSVWTRKGPNNEDHAKYISKERPQGDNLGGSNVMASHV